MKLEELSNNELILKIKEFQAEYESIKIKMLKDYDRLVELETSFDKANKLLIDRLKK